MKFLFMDETYMPKRSPVSATTLTGLLVHADAHADIRTQYQDLLKGVRPDPPNTIQRPIDVHAADLFKSLGVADAVKFDFLNGVVDICLGHDLRIYRVGYYNTPEMLNISRSERGILGLCFLGILWALAPELEDNVIWPVMERDGSEEQDRMFAGQVRSIDHMSARTEGLLSIDNKNLGELLYTTKHSAYGALVDCVAYLRHVVHLADRRAKLTPFKEELAAIGRRLSPVLVRDETIEMQFHPAESVNARA